MWVEDKKRRFLISYRWEQTAGLGCGDLWGFSLVGLELISFLCLGNSGWVGGSEEKVWLVGWFGWCGLFGWLVGWLVVFERFWMWGVQFGGPKALSFLLFLRETWAVARFGGEKSLVGGGLVCWFAVFKQSITCTY